VDRPAIARKFRDNASRCLPAPQATRVAEPVANFEHLESMQELTPILAGAW
jgi:hypothetical protein